MAHFFVASLLFAFLEGVDVLATSICLATTLLRKTEALPLSASLHLGSYFFGVSEWLTRDDKGRLLRKCNYEFGANFGFMFGS